MSTPTTRGSGNHPGPFKPGSYLRIGPEYDHYTARQDFDYTTGRLWVNPNTKKLQRIEAMQPRISSILKALKNIKTARCLIGVAGRLEDVPDVYEGDEYIEAGKPLFLARNVFTRSIKNVLESHQYPFDRDSVNGLLLAISDLMNFHYEHVYAVYLEERQS